MKPIAINSMREKEAPFHQPTVSVTTVEPLTPENGNPWRPGFFIRFPWKAFAAFVMIVICLAGAAVAIAKYNHSETDGPYKIPNVFVSICAALIGICTRVVMSEGANIYWWRSALRGGTIKELHNNWDYSSSVLSAARAGRGTNAVAVASILSLLVTVNGPLFQKAIKATAGESDIDFDKEVPLNMMISKDLSTDAARNYPLRTAFVHAASGMDDGLTLQSFTPFFANIVDSITQDPLKEDVEIGCGSFRCLFKAVGFGLKPLDCDQSSMPFDPSAAQMSNMSEPQRIFSVNASYGSEDLKRSDNASGFASNAINVTYSYMTNDYLDALIDNSAEVWQHWGPPAIQSTNNATYLSHVPTYSPNTDCSLKIVTRVCRFEAYQARYNLVADKRSVFFGGGEPEYLKRIDIPQRLNDQTSILGGFALAIRQRFSSQAYLEMRHNISHEGMWNGSSGNDSMWTVRTTGEVASRYTDMIYDWESRQSTPCNARAEDPSGLINSYILSLAFRTASRVGSMNSVGAALAREKALGLNLVASMGWSSLHLSQAIIGKGPRIVTKFETDLKYFWPALACTLTALVALVFLYPGYHEMGRKTTLSPIETGRAFDGPPLKSDDLNALIEELMGQIGARRVQYGVVGEGSTSGMKLEIADEQLVSRARPGMKFSDA